jgi:AraC-like DNA-binding protein
MIGNLLVIPIVAPQLENSYMVESNMIYSYFYFASFLLSCIVFVDVLIQIKRPLILKTYFLILVFCVGAFSFLFWIRYLNIYILLFFPILKFSIWSSMTLILSKLYFSKNKSWVYYALGFALLILIYSNFKVFYFLKTINDSAFYLSQSAFEVFSQKITNKVNLLPRFLMFTTFATVNLRLAYLIYKKSDNNNHYYKKIKKWTHAFVFSEFLAGAIFAVMNSLLFFYVALNILLIVSGNMILLIVLYRPRFINTQSIHLILSGNFRRDDGFVLTDSNFYTPFFIEHYYLTEDATLEQFCSQNGIATNELVQDEILKKYNMTFSNLVNKNRVDYFVELVKSPKYAHYSIDALAKESGFNSRNHIYKPFRKYHGGTPSDFINSLNS